MPPKRPRDHILNFDIDTHLNPLIPRSQLHRLPQPLAHFLGHRSSPSRPEPPSLILYILSFLATLAGLCLIGGVYNYAPGITQYGPPPLVASLGASAVLDYNTIKSPLAQPRNTVLGHSLSALVAVAVSKGFQQYADIFPRIDWVAAAVACATANLAMSLTNTVHPPGGATAILACIQADVLGMGFMFVPVIMLSSVLMCVVACLFNNTLRIYPVFWWTTAETGQAWVSEAWKQEEQMRREKEEAVANGSEELEKQRTEEDSDIGRSGSKEDGWSHGASGKEIRIRAEGISLPEGVEFELAHYEREFLGELQERLRLATEGHN